VLRTLNAQPTLWEAILPEMCLGMPAELEAVDRLLDDPALFEPFVAHFHAALGRPSLPIETYLRLMFLKYRYRLGFEPLCREVADSISWQRFCRIPLGVAVPHPTTLMKITTRCGTSAIDGLNEALLAKAAQAKVLKTNKLRADTTVVPANVAYPTDSGLLAKGVAKMAKSIRTLQAKGLATRTKTRDRTRVMRSRARSIGANLRRRTNEAKDEVLAINAERALHLTGGRQFSGAPGPVGRRSIETGRVTCRTRWLRRLDPRARTGYEVPVAHRVVVDRELENPAEDEPAAARVSAVEAEYEFFQVAFEVFAVHRALMGAQQPALGERGDTMDAGQQFAGVLPARARCALAAPVMDVAELADAVVALPRVGDDRCARLDMIGHERVQRGRGPVGEDPHPAPAEPLRSPQLDGYAHQGFLTLRPAAAQPRLLASDVGLIHLHRAAEPIAAGAHERRAQPVQHRPRCLIRADFERALQAERGDPILGRREPPACREPDRERRPCPIEDGARRHRRAV
jgi:IS5 family transposase